MIDPKNPPERIGYDFWANSQLSIAKYYGAIVIQGHRYVLDYDNCPTKGEGENIRYFPDLVLDVKKKRNAKLPHETKA